jgi:sec-independent protein translocase protein TatB
VFGLGFGEFLVLLLVAMIVLGPRELPRYLRKAGQFAGKIRRLANEMREKSGIDEVLRAEGLDKDLAEIRKLTRGELASLTSVVREATNFSSSPSERKPGRFQLTSPSPADPSSQRDAPVPFAPSGVVVDRMHEYPSVGADSYGALPDTAMVYTALLARSPLADDPLYARGTEEEEGAKQSAHQSAQDSAPESAQQSARESAQESAQESSSQVERSTPTKADESVTPNAPDPSSAPAEVSDEAWS